MKLYLAGGFSVANMKGREKVLYQKFDSWKRCFSYFYKELIFKSEILIIAENDKVKPNI